MATLAELIGKAVAVGAPLDSPRIIKSVQIDFPTHEDAKAFAQAAAVAMFNGDAGAQVVAALSSGETP